MSDPRPVHPYGAWPSPISVDMVVGGSRSLGAVWLDGQELFWLEGRPQEGGRQVLMRRSATGQPEDVTPPGYNVRTMVHEYGGGAFVVRDGLIVFSDLRDARLYTHRPAEEPRPLTADGPYRYADLRLDPGQERVLCIREDHSSAGEEARNSVVAVDLSDGSVTTLIEGADFYSHPRPDAAGEQLAWLCWSHPNMPWDATELWVGRLGPAGVSERRRIAGGPGESIAQPEWAPDGSLVFVSDRTGWYNLYRWRDGSDDARSPAPAGLSTPAEAPAPAEPLAPMAAEFADPQWVFDWSSYAIDSDGTIVAAARSGGRDRLYQLPPDGAEPQELEQPFTELAGVRALDGRVAFLGGGPRESTAVVLLDRATGSSQVVYRPSEVTVDPATLSLPQSIRFPTAGGREAYALFYAPTNPAVRGPDGALPPLIVISHGGPTSNATAFFHPETQFFTSRGFAVVDVDYGGSSGYGREYRQRLDGAWGIVDVEDCTHAALFLAAQGLVDRDRLLIRGGSAGGYTTLRALTTGDTFAAGASHYGVGDLEALARDTHKFESRYLDGLVGPYPESRDLYLERSPINDTDRLSCPLIVLQGEDDLVVPITQAEQLVAALEAKRIPYAYLAFAGEGHGFRRAENMARALEAELSFYAQLFGFELVDPVEPVFIAHLEGWRRRQGGPVC
ncbi:MAG: prolyl oligopeptidase family serine peptidase [Chloroflexota bacterium]|nr:prolyl oligopeptidase family serine peptidase [Chloroflexota bacterium]